MKIHLLGLWALGDGEEFWHNNFTMNLWFLEWWKILGFYSFSKGEGDYGWNYSSPRIVILGRILSGVEKAPQNDG